MIYYVDEEYNRNRSKIRFLKMNGFEVAHLSNADVAWRVLYPAQDIQLIILDVMLAAGGRYTRKETHDFLTTGLALATDLLEQRHDIKSEQILLFSAATRKDILAYIATLAKEREVLYKAKTDFDTLFDFLKYIQEVCI